MLLGNSFLRKPLLAPAALLESGVICPLGETLVGEIDDQQSGFDVPIQRSAVEERSGDGEIPVYQEGGKEPGIGIALRLYTRLAAEGGGEQVLILHVNLERRGHQCGLGLHQLVVAEHVASFCNCSGGGFDKVPPVLEDATLALRIHQTITELLERQLAEFERDFVFRSEITQDGLLVNSGPRGDSLECGRGESFFVEQFVSGSQDAPAGLNFVPLP